MEVVEGEAAAAEPAQPRRARPRRRVRDLLLSPRVLRPVAVAATLAVGVVTGLAVSQLGGGDEERTISAQVDERALPLASATLRVADDGEGAVLTAEGLPELRAGRVYQAWVQRGERIEPQPTFVAGMDGRGAVALPEDLSGATAVLVTREPRGGATRPGEAPIMRVSL
jgi:hypothetical protein